MTLRRGLVALGLLAVVGWLVLCGLSLAGAARSAERGMDELSALSDLGGSPGEVVDLVADGDPAAEAEVVTRLRAATDDFAEAHRQASRPWLAPLRIVPVIGDQVRSVQQLSESAEVLASSSADSFERIDSALAGPFGDPPARVTAVREVGASLEELRSEVAELDLGPLEGLFPPLADARDRFDGELASLRDALDRAAPAATGTAEFLAGPSRYLFLAANNAEMRAGSGMFLQAGTLDVADGRFAFGPLEATEYLVLDSPGTALDPDVAGNWSWLGPDVEFRNVNVTPRFEESARMAADMWAASGRGAVDGVMVADVYALQSLLEVVGPVEVPAEGDQPAFTVTADDVVRTLLFDQYVETPGDREVRRDREGRVAAAVLEAVNTRDVSPLDLLSAIDEAVAGRHLLLWSAQPEREDTFAAIGADGRLRGDDLGVALISRGGNKLDQFVEATARITPEGPPVDGRQQYAMTVSMTNSAPEGLPPYIGGPHARSGQPEGVWQGIVAVTLPAAAEGMVTDDPLAVFGNDGPSRVVGMTAVVPRGATEEVDLRFSLPTDATTVRLMAGARVLPTTVVHGPGGSLSTEDRVGGLIDLGTG